MCMCVTSYILFIMSDAYARSDKMVHKKTMSIKKYVKLKLVPELSDANEIRNDNNTMEFGKPR